MTELYIDIISSHDSSMKISLTNAKKKWNELLKAVEKGKRVTICRNGEPVADMVRTQIHENKDGKKKPVFGALKGKGIVIDPDWWKAMSDEEVDSFLEGKY